MSDDLLRTITSQLLSETEHPYPDMRPLARALTRVGQVQFGAIASMTGVLTPVDADGQPRVVLVYNLTQASACLWFEGMVTDSFVLLETGAQVAADGIIVNAGGFSIGVDANINTALDSVFWMVIV